MLFFSSRFLEKLDELDFRSEFVRDIRNIASTAKLSKALFMNALYHPERAEEMVLASIICPCG
ncbi:MAG: hypothetical protein Ct9H90mP27_1540 [Gammaproteobacteria bacterium]|nr:MAG: hypothetical protein Ct9H90mP27_1540 [Gammaproteobacteria bacterium]